VFALKKTLFIWILLFSNVKYFQAAKNKNNSLHNLHRFDYEAINGFFCLISWFACGNARGIAVSRIEKLNEKLYEIIAKNLILFFKNFQIQIFFKDCEDCYLK
jgi:hypothetical protein